MLNKKTTIRKKAAPKAGKLAKETPEDEHVDFMKLIYGSCSSCPAAAMGCGSAELEEEPKAKEKTTKKKVTKRTSYKN